MQQTPHQKTDSDRRRSAEPSEVVSSTIDEIAIQSTTGNAPQGRPAHLLIRSEQAFFAADAVAFAQTA